MNLRKFIIREFYNMLREQVEQEPGDDDGDALPAAAAATTSPPPATAPTPQQTAPAAQPQAAGGAQVDQERTNRVMELVNNPKIVLPIIDAGQMGASIGAKAKDANGLAKEMTEVAKRYGINVEVDPKNIENYFCALYPNEAIKIVQDYETSELPNAVSYERNRYALKKLIVANKAEHDKANADAEAANDTSKSVKERFSAAARFLYRVWKNNSNLLRDGFSEGFSIEMEANTGNDKISAADFVYMDRDLIPYVSGEQNEIPLYFAQFISQDNTVPQYDPEVNPYLFYDVSDLTDKDKILEKYPEIIPVPFAPEVDPYAKYTNKTKSFRCKNIDDVKRFQTWVNTKGVDLVVDGNIGKKTLAAIKKLGTQISLDQKTLDFINDVEIDEIINPNYAFGRNAICNHIYNLSQETQEFKDTVIKQLVKKKKQQTAATPAAAPAATATAGGASQNTQKGNDESLIRKILSNFSGRKVKKEKEEEAYQNVLRLYNDPAYQDIKDETQKKGELSRQNAVRLVGAVYTKNRDWFEDLPPLRVEPTKMIFKNSDAMKEYVKNRPNFTGTLSYIQNPAAKTEDQIIYNANFKNGKLTDEVRTDKVNESRHLRGMILQEILKTLK